MALRVASNWLGFASQFAAAFYLSPLLVHTLGDERYGVWAMLDSILAYLALFDGGLTVSVIRYVARFDAAEDRGQLNRVLSTSVALFAGAGAMALTVTLALALAAPLLFRTSPDLVGEAALAFILMGTHLALRLPLNVFPAVVSALGQDPIYNIVRTAFLVLRVGLVVAMGSQGLALIPLATITLLCGLIEGLTFFLVARRLLPGVCLRPGLVDRTTFRMIRGNSMNALAAMIAGRISFQTDSLVIGTFLGPQFNTFFLLGARLVEYAKELQRAATSVLTPSASAMQARGDHQGIRDALISSTRYLLWLMLAMQLGLFFLGRSFLSLWMGPEYAVVSYTTLVILAVPLPLSLAQSVAARILYGTGELAWFARLQGAEALANLLLSLILVQIWGIEGVALGTAIPHVVSCLALVGHVCHSHGISKWDYARRAFLVPTLAALIPGLIWANLQGSAEPVQWSGFFKTAILGVVPYALLAAAFELGPAIVRGFKGMLSQGSPSARFSPRERKKEEPMSAAL